MSHRIAIDTRKVRDFGIGTYIRNLVQGLAELDDENHYLLLVGPGGKEALGPLPERFELVQEKAPVYSIRELLKLSWKLRSLEADLYHATHYVLPAVVPCRAVVTIHDIIHLLYPEFLPNRLAFFYAQAMIRRSLSRGDRVITVSRNTRKDLLRFFEVEEEKIQVVYNGVEEQFHRILAPEDLERWAQQLELPNPYLLFVGNPKPHKNLDVVLQAYAKAREIEGFDAPLVCVGGKSEANLKIRQRAETLGISEKLKMLGHVASEALPAIYQGASLFLYPTLYEGFGLPVVEAMASGTPVITSNTSALQEIGEGYAELVDPLDVDAMGRAVARLMGDPERREALRERGMKRARDFSWGRTARETLEIYRDVLEA
ncbi:MAG: glycosyltransferase family 1 protein [Thermoanaerobaculia bacterium]|nr:glycosyltransferase family 1 protein [Thermoanaerobaculia bacterium]